MLVTGIFDLERYESRGKSTAAYIDEADWLLRSRAPLIVFAEGEHRERIAARRPEGTVTLWQSPGDPPPHEVRLERGLARPGYHWNPVKDTPRYLGLMRRKITWLRQGAELAGGAVTWVDLALRPKLGLVEPQHLIERPVHGIRLAEISYVPHAVRHNRTVYYANHYWPVAGGIIRGTPDDLRWLDERIEEEWTWCLDNGYAATDEMMLGFVRFRHPERFDVYYADHPFLADDWDHVRGSQRLVVQMGLRALDDGNDAEAQRRFAAAAWR
jgi:hypothetical protein